MLVSTITIVLLTQVVVLQPPSARSHIVCLPLLNVSPFLIESPVPHGADEPGMFPQVTPRYHCQVPPLLNEPPTRFITNFLPKHTVSGAEMLVAGRDVSEIVIVILLHIVVLQIPSART
jgi:hypothetical protein